MPITRPGWCRGARPTPRGWYKGREKLLARKFTEQEINEWYAANPSEDHREPTPQVLTETMPVEPTPVPQPELLVETMPAVNTDQIWQPSVQPSVDLSLDDMTKRELEEMARDHGVELDRRQSKRSLMSQVKKLLG